MMLVVVVSDASRKYLSEMGLALSEDALVLGARVECRR